jgi:osmotically-inducible protein OsmY
MKTQDSSITQSVSQQLSTRGLRAPCHVRVVTTGGSVTLSGMIQYEHQRRVAVQAARGVAGVQRVVDQMQVIPSNQHWK